MSEHTTGPGRPMDDETRARMRAAARRIDRVNEWLHLGGAVPPEEYNRLSEAGITHVVDLRQDEEEIGDVSSLEAMGIERIQVPVRNGAAPVFEQLIQVRQWFEGAEDSASLYVHCGGGFGRAAVMSVALLVHEGTGVDEAIELVREARPEIRLNEEQMVWLREIEARVSGARPDAV
jgi:protein-tyrosine phosphatase